MRIPTSRPAIARLQDVDASNAELLRAMRLEHEAYGRLSVVFTARVCSAPLAMSRLRLAPPIIPSILFTCWRMQLLAFFDFIAVTVATLWLSVVFANERLLPILYVSLCPTQRLFTGS